MTKKETNKQSKIFPQGLKLLLGGQLSALTTVVTSPSRMKSRVLFGKARWYLLCGPIADLLGSKQVRTLERLDRGHESLILNFPDHASNFLGLYTLLNIAIICRWMYGKTH